MRDKATFQIMRPEDIRAELRITLNVAQWTKLKERLDEDSFGPLSDLKWAINDLVNQLSGTLEAYRGNHDD